MKKLVMFLVAVLLVAMVGSQTVVAQRRESCVAYDKNRTLEGFKQVILTWKDPFIKNELWPAYAERANKILQTSKIERVRGLVVTPDEKGMAWLMSHTKEYEFSYFKQSDYYNGTRLSDKLEYRDVAGVESNWAVLEYEDVSGMYAKIKCCNPEKPKYPELAFFPSPEPKPEPVKPVFIPELEPDSQFVIIKSKKVFMIQEEPEIQILSGLRYQTPYYGGLRYEGLYYSGFCRGGFLSNRGFNYNRGGNTYVNNSINNSYNTSGSYNTSSYSHTNYSEVKRKIIRPKEGPVPRDRGPEGPAPSPTHVDEGPAPSPTHVDEGPAPSPTHVDDGPSTSPTHVDRGGSTQARQLSRSYVASSNTNNTSRKASVADESFSSHSGRITVYTNLNNRNSSSSGSRTYQQQTSGRSIQSRSVQSNNVAQNSRQNVSSGSVSSRVYPTRTQNVSRSYNANSNNGVSRMQSSSMRAQSAPTSRMQSSDRSASSFSRGSVSSRQR